jgi:hypothetical protein
LSKRMERYSLDVTVDGCWREGGSHKWPRGSR